MYVVSQLIWDICRVVAIRPELVTMRLSALGSHPVLDRSGHNRDICVFRFLKSMFSKPQKSRLARALERLDISAEAFRRAAERCGPPQSQIFWQLAGATSDLRIRVALDPAQITPLRKLIVFFIPKMAELANRWAGLAAVNPLEAADPSALAEFQSYLTLIRAAERACLSKQYSDLHASMKAVEQQLGRYAP